MFFSFLQKNTEKPDLTFLEVDMHSHVLPGLDDGLTSLVESINFIKELNNLGYKKLICTPHILNGIHNNSPKTILPVLQMVKEELKKQDIPVIVEAAAEYMVDLEFELLLEKKEPLLTFGKNYVLIEMSYAAESPNLKKIIFLLQISGMQPILAHPERYNYMNNNIKYFTELKNLGCLLQLNILSLTGYYGPSVKKMAEKLLKEGMIDFIGTDMHHKNHLHALKKYLKLNPKNLTNLRNKLELMNKTLM